MNEHTKYPNEHLAEFTAGQDPDDQFNLPVKEVAKQVGEYLRDSFEPFMASQEVYARKASDTYELSTDEWDELEYTEEGQAKLDAYDDARWEYAQLLISKLVSAWY